MGQATTLVIIEHGYRGAVETQFFDALYSAVELHRQLGGLDLLLRGTAASYALVSDELPTLRVGSTVIETLNDPRRGLTMLLTAGVGVWVEADAAGGLPDLAPDRFIPGVRCAAPGELARRWPAYRSVFFL